MTLEQLQARSGELLNSINMTTNQVFVLQGHKNEVDYQIKLKREEQEAKLKLEDELQKAHAEAAALANQAENPVV